MQRLLFRALPVFALTLFLLFGNVSAQTTIMFEDFEDATLNYSVTPADDLSDLAGLNYHGRIAFSALPAGMSYSNQQGLSFFGAQDHDNASAPSGVVLDFTGINITNFTDLELCIHAATDEAPDTNPDWDTLSSVRAEVQIDGGGYQQIFGLESESVAGNQTNQETREDTDFDGIGDGTLLLDDFIEFTKAISGIGILPATGSTLDLRITIEALDSNHEDIAFDNVTIKGTNNIPEPGTAIALLAISPLGMYYFRRRKKLKSQA